MATKDFRSMRQGDLRDWFVNFRDTINAGTPDGYGLSIEEAAAFTAAANGYIDAYAVATTPATRTTLTIEAKNTAKQAAVEQARKTVAICQTYVGMTNEKRDALRITIRDTSPSPIGPPTTSPVLTVDSVQGRVLNLRLREENSTRRGKPAGVRGAWLYVQVGGETPTEMSQMTFEGATTRTDPQIVMDADVVAGTKVYVSACWVSPTDQPGPACMPVATWTNGGSMTVKAAA